MYFAGDAFSRDIDVNFSFAAIALSLEICLESIGCTDSGENEQNSCDPFQSFPHKKYNSWSSLMLIYLVHNFILKQVAINIDIKMW